jgi:hypothetical protein
MKTLAEHLGIADPRQPDAEAAEDTITDAVSDRDFCRGVLTSKTYRESLLRRLMIDELPSAVEVMLWARAYGPVTERIEVERKDQPVENLTDAEIEQRLLFLANETRRRMNEAEPPSKTEGRSVH